MKPRRPDQGALLIVLAVSMVLLFGLAAMAVDMGFAYTKRTGLQAAADAAALAGARAGFSTTTAASMAAANNYTNGVGGVTVTTSTIPDLTLTPPDPANVMKVVITVPQPRLFASGLGFAGRNLTARATAVGIPMIPAILALGPSCLDYGVVMNGGPITINGNVGSLGLVDYNVNTATTNGSVTYNGSCLFDSGGSTITGGSSPGSGLMDPFVGNTITTAPPCTVGTMTGGVLNLGAPLANGVYCSGVGINVNMSAAINATASFITTGQITFNGNGGTLTANATGNPAVPGGFLAVSTSTLDCPASQAINIGNASITLNGSFYAPNGCINFSGNTMTVAGALIGGAVQMNAGSSSSITGPGGSSAGTAFLFR